MRPLPPSRAPISKAMRDALRATLGDGHLSEEDWHEQLQPLAEALPRRASPESYTLLHLWASSRFERDLAAEGALRDFLRSRGYPVPSVRPEGLSARALVERIAAENVDEADRAFFRLAREKGRLDAQMLVGVIDSGFDLWHPALGYKGWVHAEEIPSNNVDDDHNGKVDDSHGWDFVDWDNDLLRPDGDWHGTHCGAKAAQGTPQIRVVPLRVLPSPKPYAIEQVVEAVDYAVEQGARVFSLSFGFDTEARVKGMRAVMARHPDVLFIIAAGNAGKDLASYPTEAFLAAHEAPNLLVAAASDETGAKASFSNFGASATHAARGTEVFSAIPGAGYDTLSGTSLAAPTLANIAAKCLLLNPELSPPQLKALLAAATPQRPDWAGVVQAGGVVDAAQAYALAAQA